jgi:hypothetical protein
MSLVVSPTWDGKHGREKVESQGKRNREVKNDEGKRS